MLLSVKWTNGPTELTIVAAILKPEFLNRQFSVTELRRFRHGTACWKSFGLSSSSFISFLMQSRAVISDTIYLLVMPFDASV